MADGTGTQDSIRSNNIILAIPNESIMDTTSKELDNQLSFNFSNINSTTVKLSLSVYGNDIRIRSPFKMGNVYSFLFCNGHPRIILGPQCKLYRVIILDYMSIFLFLMVNLTNAGLILFVHKELSFLFRIIGLAIYITQIISQVTCTLINPGIPHRNNYVSDGVMHSIYQQIKYNNYKFDKYRVCKICNIIVTVEQNITHCEDCNICVEGIYIYE